MYLVCTENRNHEKSTYHKKSKNFRLKVRTFCVTYQYIPVRTEYILSLLIFVPTFLHFERVHTVYILTLVEYVLLVPDSIARPQGRPACLLASDLGTGPRIESNHTHWQAGLLTTAPLRHPTRDPPRAFGAFLAGGLQDWQDLRRRRPAVVRHCPLQLQALHWQAAGRRQRPPPQQSLCV